MLIPFRGFLQLIQFSSNLMICTSKMIMNCSYHEHIKIRTALHHLANRHLNLRNWTVLCEGICDKVEYNLHLFGVLFFIMDGFLPMMTAFFDQCWNSNMPNCAANVVMQFISQIRILCEGVEVHMSFKNATSTHYKLTCRYGSRVYF